MTAGPQRIGLVYTVSRVRYAGSVARRSDMRGDRLEVRGSWMLNTGVCGRLMRLLRGLSLSSLLLGACHKVVGVRLNAGESVTETGMEME